MRFSRQTKFFVVTALLTLSFSSHAYTKVCGVFQKNEFAQTFKLQANNGTIYDLENLSSIPYYNNQRACVSGEERKTFSGKPSIFVMLVTSY